MLLLPPLDRQWIQSVCDRATALRTQCESQWNDETGHAFEADHLATLQARLVAFRQELADFDSDLRGLAHRCQPPTLEGPR